MWQTNDKSKLRRNDSKTIIPLHQAALYIMDCWWLLWHWPREVWWHTREAVHWRVPSLPELAGLQGSFSNNFPWICLDSEPFQSYSIIIESTPTNAFRLCSSCVPHAPLPPLPQEFRTMTMSLPHCWHCWHCWPPCPGVATESIKPLPAAAKRHSTLARATQATRMPGCHVPSKVLHTVCQDDPSWPPCDHVTRITHIYNISWILWPPHSSQNPRPERVVTPGAWEHVQRLRGKRTSRILENDLWSLCAGSYKNASICIYKASPPVNKNRSKDAIMSMYCFHSC